ncbi:hypothetical protein Tco_0997504 [Tanacetum coccineum]
MMLSSLVQLRGSNIQGKSLWLMLRGTNQYLNPKSLNRSIKKKALVLHASVEKSSEEITSKKNVSDVEPLVKKLKFLIPTSSSILSPTTLNSTTSSILSPTPPRELALLRDPTPPRDESKGKGQLTQEDVMAQLKEMKRLADLKVEKEKSEKSLQKIMNHATIRAQAQKMAESEAKRKKMLDDYNHQISHRVDQLPITKISYKWVLTQTKALGVLPSPELSTFGISADDRKRKRSLEILQEVFMKENIVVNGMQRNLIPPPCIEGSRGRVIREPESGIFYYNGAIQRGTPEVEEMFKKLELTIEARNDVNQAKKIVQENFDGMTSAGIEGLAECKASSSNLKRIQVKDIVREVEDYLNTYSSAGMDIS